MFTVKQNAVLVGVCLVLCNLCCYAQEVGLKDALKGKFLMGVAVDDEQASGKDTKALPLILKNFNSIVVENCMKSEVIQPEEGKFDFEQADRFVKFGEAHKLHMVGHVLVWHSQTPKWFFVTDDKGTTVTRDVLIERMRKHITTVVTRYKGRIQSWDVVNEAFMDDGSYRDSPFYKIIGKDYIKLAFQFAREADPNAELIYNDYSVEHEGRRDAIVKLVNDLKREGIKVDGIGSQGHITMDYPDFKDTEKAIIAFAGTGAKVMITEMDLTTLPAPVEGDMGADVYLNFKYDKKLDPYADGLPDALAKQLHDRYAEAFRVFLKHQDKISRVTIWGLTDGQSWRNDWPIRGRHDYPVWFDRNYQPKPIVKTIIEEATKK
ncbi:TPA: 1,4-beta-xylanase [Candidatus Sumerlaeota bacterium]|jgi:endo-1,4-beta-xylanase|nr:1,4-beta-xylanase [Candidatus Sumerlaeota bacterium]